MPALPITVSGLKPGALGLKAFTFAPRSMKLNWRTLSQVNLDKIKREVNIDTLQDHLEMVAFANAAGADCAQYADPNFIKVFQLAQLMIEYCLYSQEVIDEARLNLQKEYETQKAKADKLAASEKALKDQVAMLKKELKLQRKTIAVYEDRLTKVMATEVKLKQASKAERMPDSRQNICHARLPLFAHGSSSHDVPGGGSARRDDGNARWDGSWHDGNACPLRRRRGRTAPEPSLRCWSTASWQWSTAATARWWWRRR